MLLVEQYVKQGSGEVPLHLARQATDELLESQTIAEQNGAPPPARPVPGYPTAADNDAAVQKLMGMMGGLSG